MALYFLGCDAADLEQNAGFQKEVQRLGGVQVLQSLWCFHLDGVKPEDIRSRFMRLVADDARLLIVEAAVWSSKSAIVSPNRARPLEYISASISA